VGRWCLSNQLPAADLLKYDTDLDNNSDTGMSTFCDIIPTFILHSGIPIYTFTFHLILSPSILHIRFRFYSLM